MGSLAGRPHCELRVHSALRLLVAMLLPLRHDAMVSVARLAVLALVSGPPMQYLLRLLEERRLALHVEAS